MHLLSKVGIAVAVLGFAALFAADAFLTLRNPDGFARAWTPIILLISGGLFFAGFFIGSQMK